MSSDNEMGRIYTREDCIAEFKMTPDVLFGGQSTDIDLPALENIGYYTCANKTVMYPLYIYQRNKGYDLVVFIDEQEPFRE